MKKLFTFTMLLYLTNCAAFKQQFDQQGLHQLIGQPETEVQKKLGTPYEIIIEKEKTKLIYYTNYKTYSNPERQIYLNPSADQQGNFFSLSCQTTFIIQNKIVSAIQTKGNCL